jgi:hypothetical protein
MASVIKTDKAFFHRDPVKAIEAIIGRIFDKQKAGDELAILILSQGGGE